MKLPRPFQSVGRSIFMQFAARSEHGGLPVQAGAMPWRRDDAGKPQVLLITSRSSGRWIIPKGHPMRGKSLAEAAAIEALEEAGVEGSIGASALGGFEHRKSHWATGPLRYHVVVFPLAVESILTAWPEQTERQRRWLAPDAAAAIVQSPELAELLRRLPAMVLALTDRR